MDQAINYNSTLLKVDRTLNNLKNIGLNVAEYENIRNEIVKKCKEEVKSSYTYPSSTMALGQSAFLEQAYIAATSALENLFFKLSSYEIYFKAASFTSILKTFIQKENKTSEEFKLTKESLVILLNGLFKSGTLDFEVEGPLVQDIYHMAYLFIKEEIAAFNYSSTLEELQKNDTHLYFLDKEVIKDLETYNLNDPKYSSILNIKNKIDAKGLDANYATAELIFAIVNSTINSEKRIEQVSKLDEQLKKYLKQAQKITSEISYKDSKFINSKQFQKKMKLDIGKNCALILTSLSIIAGLITGSLALSKSLGKSNKYLTNITLYNPNSDDPYTISEEYTDYEEDKLILHEYTPYEKVEDEFKREHTTYDLSEVGDLTFEEYLKLDLEKLGIKGITKIETKESLSIEDLYNETLSIIEQIKVNQDNHIKAKNTSNYIEALLFSILGSIVIYLIYELIYISVTHEETITFLVAIDEIVTDYNTLKDNKMSYTNYLKELQELNERLLDLINNNSHLLNEISSLLPYIETNPEHFPNYSKIKENLTLARTLETKYLKK